MTIIESMWLFKKIKIIKYIRYLLIMTIRLCIVLPSENPYKIKKKIKMEKRRVPIKTNLNKY